jgi:hypothetical protein
LEKTWKTVIKTSKMMNQEIYPMLCTVIMTAAATITVMITKMKVCCLCSFPSCSFFLGSFVNAFSTDNEEDEDEDEEEQLHRSRRSHFAEVVNHPLSNHPLADSVCGDSSRYHQ